jgi:hypothetical protein
MWTRRSAFYSCIARYCWLTRQPYHETRAAFNTQFGLDHSKPPAEQNLLDALATLEIARHRFLEQVRVFERKRIRQKLRGQRKPKAAEIQALYRAPQGHTPDGV